MNGSFVEWLRWYLAASVHAGHGVWVEDRDQQLGEGVFRFGTERGLAIYEHGIAYADGSPAAVFADLLHYRPLSLAELVQAKHAAWEDVELRLEARTGEVALALPLVHYTTLVSILTEHLRRVRRVAAQ